MKYEIALFCRKCFLHIFSETEGVKSSKRIEHSVVDTRLPYCLEAADVLVEEGKGKDSDSDLLHDTCDDPIMGTLFSQRKIRLPPPTRQPLTESLSSQEQHWASEPLQ